LQTFIENIASSADIEPHREHQYTHASLALAAHSGPYSRPPTSAHDARAAQRRQPKHLT
jgi:hypothetical protein